MKATRVDSWISLPLLQGACENMLRGHTRCVCAGHSAIIICVCHCPEGRRWRYSSWGEEASKLTFEPLLFLTACVVAEGGAGLMKSSRQDRGEMWHI